MGRQAAATAPLQTNPNAGLLTINKEVNDLIKISENCVLASICRNVDTDVCNSRCEYFVLLNARINQAEMPKTYRFNTLDSSPIRKDQSDIYEILLDGINGKPSYVSTFERHFDGGRIKSIYFYSESPGTGKTSTACGLINAYLKSYYLGCMKRSITPKQRPAYFLDIGDFQELYNEFNRKHVPEDVAQKASREYYRRMKNAKQSDFLVMDDIGLRDASQAFRSDLHAIVNHRAVSDTPTIYTSNVPIEHIEDIYDKRLYDRVRDKCAVFSFRGGSMRGNRRK